jgi:hypothetical protein
MVVTTDLAPRKYRTKQMFPDPRINPQIIRTPMPKLTGGYCTAVKIQNNEAKHRNLLRAVNRQPWFPRERLVKTVGNISDNFWQHPHHQTTPTANEQTQRPTTTNELNGSYGV